MSGGADGSWGSRDVIVFDGGQGDSIRQVFASGGVVSGATAFGRERDLNHAWPSFLPDGEHFLFVRFATIDAETQLCLGKLGSLEFKALGPTDDRGVYVEPGYILYASDNTLMARPFDVKRLDWSTGARRFDSGTPPVINAYVARAGMELLLGIGIERIREWHQVLSRRLCEGGRARGLTLHGTSDPARKTANTAFCVSDAHAIERAMRARGVLPAARGPVIRLAPHFYNTTADIDTALDLLTELTWDERA